MEFEHQSLFARFQGLLGPRYRWFCLVLALVLTLLLALAAYAEGAGGQPLGLALWRLALNPTLIVYILLIHPLMQRRWQQAMHALHALAPGVDGAGQHKPVSHRGEWVAMLLGSAFGWVVLRGLSGAEGWLRVYSEATTALMFALLAGSSYAGLARTRHLAALSRDGLALDVFDGHLLTPFARWGQSVSLTFVGGISLSLLFQSYRNLRSIEGMIIYSSLVIVALTLFFMSVRAIHVALARAQTSELAKVRRDLAAAREALHRYRADHPGAVVQEPYLAVVICGLYEKQVLAASTWPFNPTIVRQLFASAVAPLVIYALKLALGIGGGV